MNHPLAKADREAETSDIKRYYFNKDLYISKDLLDTSGKKRL